MLQVRNHSNLPVQLLVLPDAQGVESILIVIKGTYAISDGSLAAEQVPIVTEDVWAGEPNQSAFLAAHDLALGKPGTDILVVGSAHASGGRPVREVEVSIQVGALHKRMAVLGDRV